MNFKKQLISVLFGISVAIVPVSSFALMSYTVSKGDTLWGIAAKHRPAGVSTSEMMQAIKGLNVGASPSIVDNVVRLGDKLSLPETKQEAISAIEALNKAQNRYQNIKANNSSNSQTVNQPTQIKQQVQSTSNNSNMPIVPVTTMAKPPVNEPSTSSNLASVSDQSADVAEQTQVNQINPTSITSNTTTNDQSNQNAIISSVTRQSSANSNVSLTTTESGYQVAVKQQDDNDKKASDQSHTGTIIISVIIALLAILLIVRRMRKKRNLNDNKKAKHFDYYNRPYKAQPESGAYPSHPEVDASNISEVLVEAMLLLNEGRFDDARHTLQQTLKLKPDSIKIRMKLMEVYAASGDEVSFNSERDYLAANLMSHDDERWQEIDDVYQQYFLSR